MVDLHTPIIARLCLHRLVVSAVAALVIASSHAAAQAPFPDERLMQVVAPGATCAATSDRHSLLVVGVKGQADHHLRVYSIDAQGTINADGVITLTLPRPDALKGAANYPLEVVFHPTLDLVYVWQDITGVPDAQKANVHAAFDHLVVYAIEDGALKSVGTAARGEYFLHGQKYGAIAIDPQGRRIFMAGLRDDTGKHALGWFDLDEHGMPVPVPTPIAGTLDGYGLNKHEMKLLPTRISVANMQAHTTGLGLVAASADVVVFSAHNGPALWDTTNRRAALGYFPIYGSVRDSVIGAHPDLPVLFGAAVGSHQVFRMEHADGYLSMLPKITSVPGAKFQSRPVVMPGEPNRVAIGGVNRVDLLPLDAEGRFAGETQSIAVACPVVRALTYSKKSVRLYVAVEALPQ